MHPKSQAVIIDSLEERDMQFCTLNIEIITDEEINHKKADTTLKGKQSVHTFLREISTPKNNLQHKYQ
jgi:hypothetical protein